MMMMSWSTLAACGRALQLLRFWRGRKFTAQAYRVARLVVLVLQRALDIDREQQSFGGVLAGLKVALDEAARGERAAAFIADARHVIKRCRQARVELQRFAKMVLGARVRLGLE